MFRVPFKCQIPEVPTIQLSTPATVGITSVDVRYQASGLAYNVGTGWTSFFNSANQVANIAVNNMESSSGFALLKKLVHPVPTLYARPLA